MTATPSVVLDTNILVAAATGAAATGAIVISADAHLLSCRDELPVAVLTAREFLSMTGDMPGMAAQVPPLESTTT